MRTAHNQGSVRESGPVRQEEACRSEPMQSGCASEHKRRRGNSEGPADKLGDGFRDLLMGGQRNRGAGAAAGGAAALPPLPQKSLAALKLLLQMRAHENECRVPSTDIYGLSATDRESVVEFIQEVCDELKLQTITSGLAVTYFDRYAAKAHGMPRDDIEVTALICIHIATKFVETKVLHLSELGNVSAQAHPKGKLKETELQVLQVVDWQLQLSTPHAFLQQLVCLLGLDAVDGHKATSTASPPAEGSVDAGAGGEADGASSIGVADGASSMADAASSIGTTATEDFSKMRRPASHRSRSSKCSGGDSSNVAGEVCDLSMVPLPVHTPAASVQYIYKRAELLIDLSYYNFELLAVSPLVVAAGALLCGWQQLQDVEAEARHGSWLAVVCGVERAELFRCKQLLHDHFKTISKDSAAHVAAAARDENRDENKCAQPRKR